MWDCLFVQIPAIPSRTESPCKLIFTSERSYAPLRSSSLCCVCTPYVKRKLQYVTHLYRVGDQHALRGVGVQGLLRKLQPVTHLHRVGDQHALRGAGALLPNSRRSTSFTGLTVSFVP